MASEIEKTAQEIEQEYKIFIKLYKDLIEKGEKIDTKFKDRLEKIGKDLKNFRAKSKGTVEAGRLNENQFKEGRGGGKDAYERRLIKLTEEIIQLKFDFDIRVHIELERFAREFNSSLQQLGVPSTLPPVGQELKLDITEEEKEKVEAVARSMDETREKLGEVGVKETFGSPEAYIRLGIFYTQAKNFEKAKEYFERVLEIDPELAMARLNLGWVHGRLGNYKQAIKHFQKAVKIDPELAMAWNNLGKAHDMLGNYKQAIKHFQKAVKIDPELAMAWNNLGRTHGKLGNQEEARRCFRRARTQLGLPY